VTTSALSADSALAGAASPPRVEHQRDIHDLMVGVLLVLYMLFFFGGARLQARGLPVRPEDLIFLMLLPLGYRYVARPKTKLFFWIVAYFAVNFIPYFAAYYAGEYNLGTYPIIMMKELQYFYIAFLVAQHRAWWVLGAVDVLALMLVGYGVSELIAGRISYYGIGSWGMTDSPSLSGALYMFSTIWLHIRLKLLPTRALRGAALVVVLLGVVCTFATVSRTSILTLTTYLLVYVFLARTVVFPAFLAALGLTPWLIQIVAFSISAGLGLIAQQVVRRASAAQISDGLSRTGKWLVYLQGLQPPDFIFGRGTGYPNSLGGGFGLGVDSQYVRLTMERGIVGLIIVAAILLTMLVEIKRRGGEYKHAWALVVAMMVMCIPFEALQVSKSGGFFWLLMFYLLMCQRREVRRTPALEVAA
jgi:hypothetical protein